MIVVGAIIVSRLDSKRLPGKVLQKFAGRPLLDYVVQRCKMIPELSNRIILATSDRSVDDPIADFARTANIGLFRGQTNDVATRLLNCALANNFTYFLRVNGDSPFLDPALVQKGIDLLTRNEYDLVTNLYPRSYPYGVSLELINTQTYQHVRPKMTKTEYQEHISTYIYENIEQFRYANILCPDGNLSSIRMTIDTPDDVNWFERIVSLPNVDLLTYKEVIASRAEIYKS